ncbi:MAG: hypothetical protein U1E22_04350, partial [Coriobacteriia bacterium]|nr:hypothetical protein [Coriobacteriia bacterium]
MSTEPERPEDELRFVVGALREHLLWQDACGAHGFPRAPKAVRAIEPESPEIAVDSQSTGQAEPRPQQTSQPQPMSQPRPPVVRLAPKPPEERTKRLEVVGQEAKSCERCPL